MRRMLRSRWLWTLMALSASPGLIAWLLGVSPIASIVLAGVMMGCVVLAAGMLMAPVVIAHTASMEYCRSLRVGRSTWEQ